MSFTLSQLGYAQAVLHAGSDAGITPKGIVIGFATVFVESNWVIYANAAVPDSMNVPHDAVGSNGYSVGLFQQQVVGPPWWWGDAATCMDPYKSAQLFFARLARLDYTSDAQSPGSYAQEVQLSAFPDRYDENMDAAQQLYDELISTPSVPPDTYTVQSGDTLSEIADVFSTSEMSLLKANPAITNPNLIYPGQVLVIP